MLKSLIQSVIGFICAIWRTLKKAEVPLGVTLLLALGAGWAANEYLPRINQKHEYAKMKSAFIIQSLNDLNEQTGLLVGVLTEVYGDIEEGKAISSDANIRIARTISALQWEASEISMFLDSESVEPLDRYKKSLNEIKKCAGRTKEEFDQPCLDEAVLDFLQSAEDLGRELTRFQ